MKGNIMIHVFLQFCERLALLKAFHDRSIDVTGAEHIHSDTTAPQIIRPCPRKRTNGRLRRAVHTHGGKNFYVPKRSTEDDLPPVLLLKGRLFYPKEKNFFICVDKQGSKNLIPT